MKNPPAKNSNKALFSCFGWGLYLLLHLCTGVKPSAQLFHPARRHTADGVFSVTLSVASRPPEFHWHPFLRSPDFPLLPKNLAAAIAPPSKIYVFIL